MSDNEELEICRYIYERLLDKITDEVLEGDNSNAAKCFRLTIQEQHERIDACQSVEELDEVMKEIRSWMS